MCRLPDGGFTSREHIVPESLGNTELILPKGVVCDRCNNGVLATLDGVLTEFFPLKMLRTQRGIPSKSGQVPRTAFSGGALWTKAPGELVFEHNSPSQFRVTGREGPYTKFNMTASGGRRMTADYASELSRALLKMALECAWIDMRKRVVGNDFDHVRAAVLGEDRRGYLGLLKQGDPNGGSQVSYQLFELDGVPFVFVVAFLLGVTLITDSANVSPPAGKMPDDVQLFTF